jgi:hypothetical protein
VYWWEQVVPKALSFFCARLTFFVHLKQAEDDFYRLVITSDDLLGNVVSDEREHVADPGIGKVPDVHKVVADGLRLMGAKRKKLVASSLPKDGYNVILECRPQAIASLHDRGRLDRRQT